MQVQGNLLSMAFHDPKGLREAFKGKQRAAIPDSNGAAGYEEEPWWEK
jgi:hypothetical protein